MSQASKAPIGDPKLSREDIAKIEIGHTEASPVVSRVLAFAFIAVLLAVPVFQTIRELPGVPQWTAPAVFLWPKSAELKTLVNPADGEGRFAQAKAINQRMLIDIAEYETELKDRDAMVQWLIPRMQTIITGVLRGGNEKAYCGHDGWLFYRDDIDSLTSRGFLEPSVLRQRAASGSELMAPPQPDPVLAIVDFRDQLAARGIELIIVPAPVKPTVHPEFYSRRYEGRSVMVQNPSYGEFKERLADAGVAIFDPADLFIEDKANNPDEPLYLKTDTHWTPQTMERTAAALAEFAREKADLSAGSPERYTTEEMTIDAMGDIALMLNLPDGQDIYPPETMTIRQVMEDDLLWRPETSAEVLFLGDSFANIYSLQPMGFGESAGFVEHISHALGLPVDAITQNDAGSHATRATLSNHLRSGRDRLDGKKLVIWEFASRELARGDWKLLSMELGEERESDMYVPSSSEPVEVRATVLAATRAPIPGSVPYKDHIIMVHLDDLQSTDDPDANGKAAVAFTWSMRDNVLTPASRYRPGDVVTLKLQPWADVESQYGAFNRREFDDIDLMLEDPVWAE